MSRQGKKIAFIGGGKMGEAIVSALIQSRIAQPKELTVCEVVEERRKLLAERYGVNVAADVGPILGAMDVIFFAVKPQNLDKVLQAIQPMLNRSHLAISIAAGKRLAFLEERLPGVRVVRVMPNLASMVSEGMSVFCAGAQATSTDRETVVMLLSSFGKVLELPESQFDAVTALSGSGPAFLAYYLQSMIEAGVDLGLAESDARILAEQTMLGTVTILAKGGMGAGELIRSVSSPGGTTMAGLDVLTRSPIKDIVRRTLEAAARRGEELSR